MGRSVSEVAQREHEDEMQGSIERSAVLLIQVHSLCCALPLSAVIEHMRPLPVVRFSGQPPFILGISIIRGVPTPVVDLGFLVAGGELPSPARFVTVRTNGRPAALAVSAVHGLRSLDALQSDQLPTFLHQIEDAAVSALAIHDSKLLAVLNLTRVVPDDVWRALDRMYS